MIRSLIALVFLWNLLGSPAIADAFQGDENGYSYEERGVSFRYWTAVNVSSLVGEPIVDARVRWEIDADQSSVVLPSFRNVGEDQEVSLALLSGGLDELAAPQNVWPKIYNLDLAYIFEALDPDGTPSRNYAFIIADVGVLGIPDGRDWSFNISGSPQWDRFLAAEAIMSYPSAFNFENPSYLSEEDSKSFMRNMRLVGVQIVEINISFFDIQHWYAQNSPYAQLPGLRYAYTRLKAAVERISGYELPTTLVDDELMRDVATNSKTIFARSNGTSLLLAEDEDIAWYRELVSKLYNLPDEFLVGANEELFRREAERAREEGNRLTRETRTFVSDEVDTSQFERGTNECISENLTEGATVFIGIDWSGSMNGVKRERAVSAISRIVDTVPDTVTVRVNAMNGFDIFEIPHRQEDIGAYLSNRLSGGPDFFDYGTALRVEVRENIELGRKVIALTITDAQDDPRAMNSSTTQRAFQEAGDQAEHFVVLLEDNEVDFFRSLTWPRDASKFILLSSQNQFEQIQNRILEAVGISTAPECMAFME